MTIDWQVVQVRKWFSLYGREIISRYRPENSSLPLLYARAPTFPEFVQYLTNLHITK